MQQVLQITQLCCFATTLGIQNAFAPRRSGRGQHRYEEGSCLTELETSTRGSAAASAQCWIQSLLPFCGRLRVLPLFAQRRSSSSQAPILLSGLEMTTNRLQGLRLCVTHTHGYSRKRRQLCCRQATNVTTQGIHVRQRLKGT